MRVSYYYRKPAGFYSIERVFDTVQRAMPKRVVISRIYCWFERGVFGRLCNMLQARIFQSDINHVTGDVYYLGLALNPKRTILTIHDCGSIKFRTGWRRELVRLFWFEWPVRLAAAITTISESTRDDLLRLTSCRAEKISIIPNPLSAGFERASKPFSENEPGLLQVGTIECKNLENVVRALQGVCCHLTIVGRLSPQQRGLLQQCSIRYTSKSDLNDAEMIDAYRQADVVLLCSTHEGFGMPVIEANAMGRPVVTSDIDPLRGVAGNAACLVDPHSVESIRAGILRVIEDRNYRDELVRRGFENAARFDARQIAARYCDVYEKLLAAAN